MAFFRQGRKKVREVCGGLVVIVPAPRLPGAVLLDGLRGAADRTIIKWAVKNPSLAHSFYNT